MSALALVSVRLNKVWRVLNTTYIYYNDNSAVA